MSGVAHNLDQEFWQPPAQAQASQSTPAVVEVCPRCSTDFVVGARFCHICGAGREPQPGPHGTRLMHLVHVRAMRDSLGLTTGALIAFAAGIACIIAAVLAGLLYTATTMTDWQAIQVWRIEWLLAATVAFVGGILLNRR